MLLLLIFFGCFFQDFEADRNVRSQRSRIYLDPRFHSLQYFDQRTSHAACPVRPVGIDRDPLQAWQQQMDQLLVRFGGFHNGQCVSIIGDAIIHREGSVFGSSARQGSYTPLVIYTQFGLYAGRQLTIATETEVVLWGWFDNQVAWKLAAHARGVSFLEMMLQSPFSLLQDEIQEHGDQTRRS
jgi:hypothetical protein